MIGLQKEYPYQNLSLENLEGEIWEDLPGADGYYLISNLGRIKRQEYEMQKKDGTICKLDERIIKPRAGKRENKFIKDFNVFLVAKVIIEGRRICFSVSRMVHYCFVHPFNLEDKTFVIIFKDRDNFNIHPSNLLLVNLEDKRQRTIKLKRFRSAFLDLSAEQRISIGESRLKAKRKEVTQYNLKGEKIKTFESAAKAAKDTGANPSGITISSLGTGATAGGFLWAYGNKDKIQVSILKRDRQRAQYSKHVTQYDSAGRKINTFPSIKKAAEEVGAHKSGIQMVLRGKYKTCKGFFWIKGVGTDFMDLKNRFK